MKKTYVYVDETINVDGEAEEVLERGGYKLTDFELSEYALLVMPTSSKVQETSKGHHIIALEIMDPQSISAKERVRRWFKAGATDVRDYPEFAGERLGLQILDILTDA